MRRLLIVLLLIALGVGAIALLAWHDPGQATLQWGDWHVQTSLAALLGIAVLAMLLVGLILRLLSLLLRAPTLWRQRKARRQQERALRDLTQGVISLIEGDWRDAEQMFKRHTDDAQGGLLWLIGTALAAHRQGLSARRDDALRLAEQRYPEAASALRLLQAEMLLDEGRDEGALSLLQALHAEAPRQPHVLRLLTELHRRRGEWEAVLQRLPELTRLRALPEDRLLELEEEAVEGRLTQLIPQGREAIDAFWHDIRRSLRGRERLLAAYSLALAAAGHPQAACELLLKALRERPSTHLASVLARLQPAQPKAALEAVEALLQRYGEDAPLAAPLHLFAARQAWALDLWGKARSHAEATLAQAPSAEAHALLARVLEREGHREQALEHALKGLAQNTG
ncbi:MAG: heme biosynthesis HemY N-terminal domain-containing protein [Gammaproteobacteria bacterium]|nr:heme biosynthesis HemY N-terminal domain-containing protein [Gammaproteobacteria bacterium]